MYKNYYATKKDRERWIIVTKENEVKVIDKKKLVEERMSERTVMKRQYQLVTLMKVGNQKFAYCVNANNIDIYSLTFCELIVSAEKGESVWIQSVAGEAFFKVIDAEEEYAYVYDSTGVLLAKEKAPIMLDVVFSGVGACIQKSLPNGKKILYSLEGYLVG